MCFLYFLSSFCFINVLQRGIICNIRKKSRSLEIFLHIPRDWIQVILYMNIWSLTFLCLKLLPNFHTNLESSSCDHMQSELPINGLAQIIEDFGVGMEWNKLSKIGCRFSWCFLNAVYEGLSGLRFMLPNPNFAFSFLGFWKTPIHSTKSCNIRLIKFSNCEILKLYECITTALNSSCNLMQN